MSSICYSDADMKTLLNFTLSAVWHQGQDEYQNSLQKIHQFLFFRVNNFFYIALDKSPNLQGYNFLEAMGYLGHLSDHLEICFLVCCTL